MATVLRMDNTYVFVYVGVVKSANSRYPVYGICVSTYKRADELKICQVGHRGSTTVTVENSARDIAEYLEQKGESPRVISPTKCEYPFWWASLSAQRAEEGKREWDSL